MTLLAKGQLDTSVRYVGGSGSGRARAYTQKVTAYDALYHAVGTQLVAAATTTRW